MGKHRRSLGVFSQKGQSECQAGISGSNWEIMNEIMNAWLCGKDAAEIINYCSRERQFFAHMCPE